VRSLAGAVPKIFGKTDVTHVDFWLAALFDLLVTGQISAVVMVKGIRKLLKEESGSFMPSTGKLYEACCDVRHEIRQLRDELVRIESLPPPRLPELPAPTLALIECQSPVPVDLTTSEDVAFKEFADSLEPDSGAKLQAPLDETGEWKRHVAREAKTTENERQRMLAGGGHAENGESEIEG
jgi:hypothetical protein